MSGSSQIYATLGYHSKISVIASAFILVGALAGWGISTTLVEKAVASEQQFKRDSNANAKAALVGSYKVTGTDPDGEPYASPRTVDVSLSPSGALELNWDDGALVGVGQLIDNGLAVAYSIKGRNVIAIMNINSDGSLSGRWLRRTDRGSKGTETWKKV